MLNNLSTITNVIILIGIFIISVVPLHKAVKIVKGKTTFLKSIFIVFISGIIISIINVFFKTIGSLLIFIILIIIYKKSFKLKWHKAFFVWILHLAFVVVSAMILNFIIYIISNY